MALTEKDKLFCLEFIKENFNGTKAYRNIYKVNEQSARRLGSRKLTNVDIQKEIKKLISKSYKKSEMDVDKLLGLMVKRATYDSKDFFEVEQITLKDANGKEFHQDIVQLKDWSKIDGTLISEIKQNKDGAIQIKLPDKDKSIEMIGRHFAMFTDKTELTGKDGESLGIIVLPAKKKVGDPVDNTLETKSRPTN